MRSEGTSEGACAPGAMSHQQKGWEERGEEEEEEEGGGREVVITAEVKLVRNFSP